MKYLDDLFRQLEIILGSYILLLYAGSNAKVVISEPISEIELSNHHGFGLFCIITLSVLCILLSWRQEIPEIIVQGPMTQQEYIKLQDVLAYQA